MGPPAATTSVEPEAAYYQTIEESFVARRGDPLCLSNADWLLIRRWRHAGIPLRVVLRGIADAFEGHAHSWGRDRKVGSLAYCASEVVAARDRWRRALALGEEPGIDPRSALRALAEGLESASGLGPRATAVAHRLATALRARAERAGDMDDDEAWLTARNRELLGAVRGDATAETLLRIESATDAALAPYTARMPQRVLAQIRTDSIDRQLLEESGLPRLTLFTL